jgi:putative transposase
MRRQCALLGLARSGVYGTPRPAKDDELAVMRRLDELFTAWPFLGSRRMAAMLRSEGRSINRKRVQRLMRKMGIAALGPKPRTTQPAPGHKIYPYLLRDMTIERANHVWATDITPGSSPRAGSTSRSAGVPLPRSSDRLGESGGAVLAAV